MTTLFYFDRQKIVAMAEKLCVQYQSSSPFPFVCIDNFLPSAVAERIVGEIPKPGQVPMKDVYHTRFKASYAPPAEELIGEFTRHVMGEFNSSAFVEFLEILSGIDGLIPDPHFFGGGIHQTRRDGFLKVHADFNWHERLKLDRRINVLLFLNKDWKEEYGGILELWDEKMTACVERILPVFNRLVIFNTSDHSMHGHPDPLNCPENIQRNSLAFYYYSNGRPGSEIVYSQHLWTLYRERPGERVLPRDMGYFYKKLLPTSVVNFLRKIKAVFK